MIIKGRLVMRALLAAALLTACGSDGPLMYYHLAGGWCEPDSAEEICLVVDPGDYHYVWTINADDCAEIGVLSGGLEFTPIRGDRCLAPEWDIYSASGRFTDTGRLELTIDMSLNSTRANGITETRTLRLDPM